LLRDRGVLQLGELLEETGGQRGLAQGGGGAAHAVALQTLEEVGDGELSWSGRGQERGNDE